MKLHPDVQFLLDAMRALEHHLERFDEFWAAHVRRAADEVANSDAHGVQCFLGLFGRMGSLNDLVLHRDGKPLLVENGQLNVLRSRSLALAHGLRNEAG